MAVETNSQQWPSDRAVLLVHGIGNAKPGDYEALLADVRTMLGTEADNTAIYQLWYDEVNDWFVGKTQVAELLKSAVGKLAEKLDDPEIGQTIAEVCGDILWPVLSADARAAVREVYLLQLKQMVDDGTNAGIRARDQKLSIICHSLGCFHTYEALHHAALFPSAALQPATHGVRFENVVFMASPVQLIRTVAEAMGSLVPNRRWLYTVKGDKLFIPFQEKLAGGMVRSVKRWVSITGDLDPVGGHFFRKKADWAYMQVDGEFPSIVDKQAALNISTKAQLAQSLLASLRTKQPPNIGPNNPHSWENYVTGHSAELREWLTA